MKRIWNTGLWAIVAASAAFLVCLAGPGASPAVAGVAIPKFLDYMKKGKRVEDDNAAIVSKLGQIELLLGEIDTLRSSNSQLLQEMQDDQSAMGEEAVRYEEAQKVFDEQVAAVLSPELAQQVSQELENARQAFTVNGTVRDESLNQITEMFTALDESLGACRSSFDEAKKQAGSLDAAIKGSWNVKANVK